MTRWLKTYLIALVVFLIIDALWIAGIALGFYKAELGDVIRATPNILPAVLFYLLFILGLQVFVIAPQQDKAITTSYLAKSALFGIVCYGTYALTNLSVVMSWSMAVSTIDTIWGAVVATITAVATHFLTTMRQEIS